MMLLARLDQDAAGREIRARNELDQLLDRRVRVLDQMQQRRAELVDIVRRECWSPCRRRCRTSRWRAGSGRRPAAPPAPARGRRSWGGSRRRSRRCRRAAPAATLVRRAFGVALGRRIIAVDVAEVALAVDQRVADGEVLGEAGQRVVDRLVAVRDGSRPWSRRRSWRTSGSRRRDRGPARAWRRGCAGARASGRRARRAAPGA